MSSLDDSRKRQWENDKKSKWQRDKDRKEEHEKKENERREKDGSEKLDVWSGKDAERRADEFRRKQQQQKEKEDQKRYEDAKRKIAEEERKEAEKERQKEEEKHQRREEEKKDIDEENREEESEPDREEQKPDENGMYCGKVNKSKIDAMLAALSESVNIMSAFQVAMESVPLDQQEALWATANIFVAKLAEMNEVGGGPMYVIWRARKGEKQDGGEE